MTPETISAFLLFAALMVGTPGPANMLALGAGARSGLRGCVSFIAGLISGKVVLNVAIGAGLYGLLQSVPWLLNTMRWASFLYIVWLAWRIAGASIRIGENSKPLGFRDGLIVHPLNPKAWAMVTTAYAQFTDPAAAWWPQILTIAAGFMAMQAVFHTLWAAAGERISTLVAGTRAERGLMIALGLATLATVLWAMVGV